MAIVIAAAFAFACGGGNGTPAGSATPAAGTASARPTAAAGTAAPTAAGTPQAVPTGDASLTNALMTAADVGPGWTEQPVNQSGLTVAQTTYCDKKLPSIKSDVVALFVNPATPGSAVFEVISRLADETTARAAVDAFSAVHLGCSSWSSTNGVQSTEWQIASFAPASVGDQAFVEKATTQVAGATSTGVFILARRGRTVFTIVESLSSDFDVAETTAIAVRAIARFDGANP